MITQAQYIRLVKEYQNNGGVVTHAALKANMHPETAARYLKANAGPEELKQARRPRPYRTRSDPLQTIMPEAARYLETAPEIEAKGLLVHLKIAKPEVAGAVALRTFQRGVKVWRAQHGPPKEVFFPQAREPGRAAQFDWKRAAELGVTIAGAPFDHLLGHFVLPFSNWQRATICFSESFASLKTGVQAGYWSLGGVTADLWTDNSSTATHQIKRDHEERTFNDAYTAFCRHLKVAPRTINLACPHEQGDVESAHRHLLRRLQTHLAIRGSSDFPEQAAYQEFLDQVCTGANSLRTAQVAEEIARVRPLPDRRYPETEQIGVSVTSGSTVRLKQQTYSVPSKLIGLKLDAHLSEHQVRFTYEGHEVCQLPRMQGTKPQIDYRHVITWLVRKPGAFRGYLYREEMFPTVVFRQAYDRLCATEERSADARYLQLLELAAQHGESEVADLLGGCLRAGEAPRPELIKGRLQSERAAPAALAPFVPDLKGYDSLLTEVSA
jgi:transposase